MIRTPEPTYNITTLVNHELVGKAPIADPFISTTTTIEVSRRDALRALLTRKGLTFEVTTSVYGNADAYLHVMNPRPIEVAEPGDASNAVANGEDARS